MPEDTKGAQASVLRGPRERDEAALVGPDAVAKARDTPPDKLGKETADAALAWFMEDDDEVAAPAMHTIQVNVAHKGQAERWIDWTFTSLDQDVIDAIRQRARGGNRRARRAGELPEVNEAQAALGIVAAATVRPDLERIRQAKGVLNREQVVKHRFRAKPGLILQISGEIIEFSGYSDEDVREANAVAAKNS